MNQQVFGAAGGDAIDPLPGFALDERSGGKQRGLRGYRRRARGLALIWWLLTLVGSLALVSAPNLAWVNNSLGDTTISINGFNATASDTGLPNVQSLTDSLSGQDDGTSTDLPSLSSIPQDSGGSDSNARGGIFVLIIGVTCLFLTLWTAGGEIERRRSMMRLMVLLGTVALLPLLSDMFKTLNANSALVGTNSVGTGIIIGILGAVCTIVGGGLLYWTLGLVTDM